MIMFSFVIPHYNTPHYLKRLICSIPQRNDLEIIVVDDRSTDQIDEYKQCVKEYSSSTCVFVTNDREEKGAGICRNIGIEMARGKWVIFADSDDYFTSECIKSFEKGWNSPSDVLFFYPTCKMHDGTEGSRHTAFCHYLERYYSDPSQKNEIMLRYHVVSPWGKMIRRELLICNNIRFENSPLANDMLFCRQLGVHANKIEVIPETVYVLIDRPGSLTKQRNKEALNIRRDVFVRSCKYVKEHVDKKTYKLIHYTGGQFTHLCRVYHLGWMKYIETCWYFISRGVFPVG